MSILFLHVTKIQKMDIYIGFSLQIYVIQVRRKPTENLQEIRKWHSIYLGNSEL